MAFRDLTHLMSSGDCYYTDRVISIYESFICFSIIRNNLMCRVCLLVASFIRSRVAIYQWSYVLHVLPYCNLKMAERIVKKFSMEVYWKQFEHVLRNSLQSLIRTWRVVKVEGGRIILCDDVMTHDPLRQLMTSSLAMASSVVHM